MKSRRFARVWFSLAVGFAVLASPASGSIASWTVVPTPNPGGWGNIIWGMSALGQRNVWAVGVQATYTSNDPLAMHWDGTSWTAVPTPTPVPDCEDGNIQWAGNSLNAVDGVTANDVWAVGGDCYGMHALLERWNGNAWSIVTSPSPPNGGWATLYGVEAISSSNVWAVGYVGSDGTQPLVEHWNGQSWSIVASVRLGHPGGAGDGYLTAITATGPNDVWAVGSAGDSTLIEHFDGNAWSLVPHPEPAGAGLDAITAISPTNVWAVGSQRAGSHLTLVMHYDGRSWRVIPSPNPSTAYNADNELRGIAAAAPNDIWAVGMYQNEQTAIHQHRTLIEHWDGTSWNVVTSPSPGHSSELNAATAPTRQANVLSRQRVFAAGLFSNYDINIYDGTYTDPRTLVMDSR